MKVKTKWIGPGGLNCPCCTMFKTKKETKQRFWREQRRKSKQEVNQIEDY